MSADTEAVWPDRDREYNPTVTEFCETHDLVRELVPFASRAFDPWELVARFDAELRALPTTAATFQAGDLLDVQSDARAYWSESVRVAAQLLGAWPLNESQSRPARWVNPHYVHERALAPPDIGSREAHLRDCAALGVLDQEDIAPRFGIEEKSLRQWCWEHGVPWTDLRRDGKRQMARTIATAKAWNGYDRAQLAASLPVTYRTIHYWEQEFVNDTEWSVPDDPSITGGVSGD